MHARTQIDLLDGAAAKLVQLQPEAKPVLRRALDQPAALEHHQRAMRRALVQAMRSHTSARPRGPFALAQQLQNRDRAIEALQLIRIGGSGFFSRLWAGGSTAFNSCRILNLLSGQLYRASQPPSTTRTVPVT
jgi:hypothetical protein